MLGKIWTQMRSSYTKNQMTGLTLIPTQQRVGLPLTRWTTQADEVDFSTILYLCLDHKEANKSIIVSQLASRWLTASSKIFRQYYNMYTWRVNCCLTRVEEGVSQGWGYIVHLFKIILLHSSMCKRIYFLEAGKDFWMSSY